MRKLMTAGIGLLGCLGLLSGCSKMMLPGAVAGGSEYYHYTSSNVARETLMGDVADLTVATKSALEQMDIGLQSVTPYTDKTVILATTAKLDITIDIVPITASSSQIIVDAREDHIITRDKATADEILSQIRLALARKDPAQDAFSMVFAKNDCRLPIYVAVRFLAGNNEPEHWQTWGWFLLAAGRRPCCPQAPGPGKKFNLDRYHSVT
jgi:hypothetical protein